MLGETWKGYYLTAYGIAVKHGFVGTEEEWLASLRGEAGAAAELRYNEEEKTLEWRPKGSETWESIVPLSELQGDLVSATLEEADDAMHGARQANEQAAASAKAAAESKTKAIAAEKAILQHIEDYGTVITGAYVYNDVLYIQTSNGKVFAAGNVRGRKGETGDSGVYIGAAEPTDEDVRVWIDPSDHETLDELMGILDKLRYTDGGVEVDLSEYLKVEGALPIENGGHGGTTVREAQENLGLTYVSAPVNDDILCAEIPGIEVLVPGVVARVIPEADAGGGMINVNGLGARAIKRYASDNNTDRHDIPEIEAGGPIELVYDGEYWICTQLLKPNYGDVEGLAQMRADIDYIADVTGVVLS